MIIKMETCCDCNQVGGGTFEYEECALGCAVQVAHLIPQSVGIHVNSVKIVI